MPNRCQREFLGVFLAGALLLLAGFTVRADEIRGSAGGGGGEIPTPFEAYNQKVELADGEAYVLVGRVVIDNIAPDGSTSERMRAFFEIDLNEHPWLGNTKRKMRPFYPLEGAVSTWRRYNGMRVKLPCIAVGGVVYTPGQQAEYVIWLRKVASQPIEPYARRARQTQ